ncbi:MAG: hypothetical protein QF632_00970 [Candidatus Woesearchaeota archaeon]|nr:hypothetical protein [Candidatus Woesearchaeota archaeon]MDP7323313.1 hypothetical protein [Candidatus Woesearchaeota archaeon]MDP7457820.1 hypothetical protein [Candidatus Woesearchaeota archaeon]
MKRIAMVYDVDFTLMRGYHPSIILENRGLDVDCFWRKVSDLQRAETAAGEHTDSDIIYLAMLLHEVKHGELKGLSLNEIMGAGKNLEKYLYDGLPQFFPAISMEFPQYQISHNIVSVGIKPLIDGSVLGKYMDKVFGYTFFDNLTMGDEIDQIKTTTSKLEKIAYVVNISTGDFNDGYKYPIKDLIYFGDGQTDKDVFRFVKKKGGTSICVYDPADIDGLRKAQRFRDVVNYILPADYTVGSALWNRVGHVLAGRNLVACR